MGGMHEPTSSSHRRDIDGLRAIAVFLVIVHHVAPHLMPGGFVGVDVFFVISGFLMTRIIDDAMQAGAFSYVEFVWRRCRRIVPALATVLTATTIAGLCILTGPELSAFGKHLAAGSLWYSNVQLWSEVGYFDSASALKPLLHLWSLGVEEQFYLLWPLILGLLPLDRRIRVLAILAIVAFSLLLSENLAYSDPSQAFYMLHSRAWELGIGGLLAFALPPAATNELRLGAVVLPGSIRPAASVLGIVMILVAATRLDGAAAWPGITALLPVLGTAFVIAAGPASFVNRTLLSSRTAEWIGKRSYALYLWHWPPLAFVAILAQERGWTADSMQWLNVALMLPVIALAHLTLRYIERPARQRAAVVARAGAIRLRQLRPYAFSLASLAIVAATLIVTRGLPMRYGTAGVDALATLRDASPDSVTTYDHVATRCRLPDKGFATWCWRIAGEGKGIAVFGDSHAEVLFAGLAAQRAGTPLFLTGRKGCAPILHEHGPLERTSEICRRSSALAHDAITRDTSIGTVLVVSRGPAYMSGVGFGVDSQRLVVPVSLGDSTALRRAFERGMEASIRALQASGKHVMLVLDSPELGFLPEECVIGRPFGLRTIRRPCAIARGDVDARNVAYRRMVSHLQERLPALEVFDTTPILCDAAWCHAVSGTRLLYSDGNHLTMLGSRMLVQRLRPLLDDRHPVPARIAAR